MATGICRECSREVSSDAKSCPHCGVSKPVPQRGPSAAAIGCIGLVAVAAIAIISSRNSPSRPARPVEPEHPSSGSAHLVSKGLVVWRSKEAMAQGIVLIVRDPSGKHPELVLPLSSCLPDGGDEVTILDAQFGSREVILNSGPQKGCRGWVAMEDVVR